MPYDLAHSPTSVSEYCEHTDHKYKYWQVNLHSACYTVVYTNTAYLCTEAVVATVQVVVSSLKATTYFKYMQLATLTVVVPLLNVEPYTTTLPNCIWRVKYYSWGYI